MSALKIIHLKYAQVVMILMVLITCVPGALGQESSQYDKGTPPQHAAGVSPLGSYMSADLGTINLSNGALNIKLPLASVGGRGFSMPLTLNYSSKVWSASRHSNFADETGNHPVAHAEYADIENLMDLYSRVAPGWTIGAAPTLVVRGNGIKDDTASLCAGDFRFGLTKLTVILPDKGELQLRDDATNGAPLATQVDPSTGCMARDGNRGQRWHASDGSGIVFVGDTANGIVRGDLNGVLILADGTRYRFASLYNPPSGSPPLNLMTVVKLLARSTSITDRNGNRITITYPSANEVRYTDQLGRITKIEKNVPDPTNPSVTLAFLVTVPGYQGQNRYFKIKSALMNQRYRPGINPTLPVINGDFDPTVYDLVGRVQSVTTPDTAVVNTSYSGNTVTVTDQAGKKRKSVTDALGRLIEVYEDPEVPGGPAELNYQTTYLYDALDNLAKVTQESQQRFFIYDSLKRLICARNPEQGTLASLNLSDPITSNNSWSVGYEYDSNGNLIKKTDARGVESNYVYDAFNRNTTIDYTDTAINPDVKRFYDGATKGKGRFWQFYKGGDLTNGLEVDHTSVDSYDEAGRPLIKRQLFKTGGNWSPNTYQIERTYNRGGGVKTQKYPSLRSVTNNYDFAGRLADQDGSNLAFKGSLGDGVERT